jgi:hypothetical protein
VHGRLSTLRCGFEEFNVVVPWAWPDLWIAMQGTQWKGRACRTAILPWFRNQHFDTRARPWRRELRHTTRVVTSWCERRSGAKPNAHANIQSQTKLKRGREKSHKESDGGSKIAPIRRIQQLRTMQETKMLRVSAEFRFLFGGIRYVVKTQGGTCPNESWRPGVVIRGINRSLCALSILCSW